MRTPGRFITFEGIDGSGKTTQIDALEKFLTDKGIEVVRTREPGGAPLSEKLRELILTEEMTITTETLLFFAARAEHVARTIRPALERGAWVLSDRFTDATYAYQVGAKGFPAEKCLELERWTLEGFAPDVTVLFDLAPEVAETRRRVRAGRTDRFEEERRDFFVRVRNAYLERAAAHPERYLVLDASEGPSEISNRLLKEAARWL